MRRLVVVMVLLVGLLSCELASAGQSGEFYCTSCGYKRQLTIDGSKKSPRLTVYCSQCRAFSYRTFASWKEANEAKEFVCPQCSSTEAFVYKGQPSIPCPKCSQKTTQFKKRILFD